jgi:hypothetical protein
MGDYTDGKSAKGHVQNVNVSQQREMDIDALAQAVAKAIGKVTIRGGTVEEFADTFDDKKSMEALADSMVVQRGKRESNFEDLGGIKETKKNQKEVDKTIDILSNLDD